MFVNTLRVNGRIIGGWVWWSLTTIWCCRMLWVCLGCVNVHGRILGGGESVWFAGLGSFVGGALGLGFLCNRIRCGGEWPFYRSEHTI